MRREWVLTQITSISDTNKHPWKQKQILWSKCWWCHVRQRSHTRKYSIVLTYYCQTRNKTLSIKWFYSAIYRSQSIFKASSYPPFRILEPGPACPVQVLVSTGWSRLDANYQLTFVQPGTLLGTCHPWPDHCLSLGASSRCPGWGQCHVVMSVTRDNVMTNGQLVTRVTCRHVSWVLEVRGQWTEPPGQCLRCFQTWSFLNNRKTKIRVMSRPQSRDYRDTRHKLSRRPWLCYNVTGILSEPGCTSCCLHRGIIILTWFHLPFLYKSIKHFWQFFSTLLNVRP